jgi:ring-1,2-phenylacetyl-CoA epoxidase subunit PaaE
MIDTVDAAPAPGSSTATFHPLVVTSIETLTDDAVAVTFGIPASLAAGYRFTAGQHVIVRRSVDGVEHRRTYSICAPEGSGDIRIGVRRITDGVVSTWITSRLRVGDVVEVSTPAGSFGRSLAHRAPDHVAMVAVGSGITPTLSMIATHLATTSHARATLILGNRSASSTMFLDEIASLKDRYLGRLHVIQIFSREERIVPLQNGRIDQDRTESLLAAFLDPAEVDEWFLCGPLEAMSAVETVLLSRDVDPLRIHRELFHAGRPLARRDLAASDQGTQVEVLLNGSRTVLTGRDLTGSILDGVLAQRADAPFSCRNGICGTCKARTITGTVEMESTWALDSSEIDDGIVLTCQARPTSERVSLEFL